MKHDLQNRVLETIERHAMIRPGDRVGLGISGGADSVAMLRIFRKLQPDLGITLVILHFNHLLRGAVADEDERFVQSLAREFQLEFESGREDVSGEARLNGWNLEDAARRLRYRFFSSAAEALRLDRVAVAHTANDQAETLLSHLLRGTGLAGLAGIYPVAGRIIRPLIEVEREELRGYLSEAQQVWREDATNEDTSRTRARIRHRLIPLLLRDFDASAVKRLSRFAQLAREDEVFWRGLEEERLQSLTRRESSSEISLPIESLLSPLPLLVPTEGRAGNAPSTFSISANVSATISLTRRLVRRIFAELRGSRQQLTARHVESVIELATKSQSGARIDLPGVVVEKIFDRLCFRLESATQHQAATVAENENAPRGNFDFAYTIQRPERWNPYYIVISEIHRRFNLKMVDWPPAQSDTIVGWGALDFDRVQWPLVLRNWRPGDSYRPHGSRRARKLKRLLSQSRVPRNLRGSWPVLTSEGNVIWASGYPVAEELAPRQGTQTGLIICEEEV
jgi:tRNA(Ile)-lysidine synthase